MHEFRISENLSRTWLMKIYLIKRQINIAVNNLYISRILPVINIYFVFFMYQLEIYVSCFLCIIRKYCVFYVSVGKNHIINQRQTNMCLIWLSEPNNHLIVKIIVVFKIFQTLMDYFMNELCWTFNLLISKS